MSALSPEGADASPVAIYDTTLRDGTQREGISLACSDKLRIAQQLDLLGVAFIEGGWPGSNPKDAEFFRRLTKKVGFPRGDVVRPLWPAPAFRRSSAVPGLASRVGVGVPMLRATRTW